MWTAIILLYMVDVMRSASLIMLLGGGFSLAIWFFGNAIYADCHRVDPDFWPNIKRQCRWIFGVMVVGAFISAFTPGQRLAYITAGLLVGEEVVESELGQKAVAVINQRLDGYLEVEVDDE